MTNWYWISIVTGFFLAVSLKRQVSIFLPRNGVLTLIKGGFRIGWLSLYLLLFYFYIIKTWIPSEIAFFYSFLILLPLAFLLATMEKSKVIPLVSFALTYYCIITYNHDVVLAAVYMGRIYLGAVLFQIIMLGCLEKMKLAQVPRVLEGAPAWFLSAAFLSLAFYWLVQ